jgi:hypothetical protein
MIRNFNLDSDVERAKKIHAANELPENCFPNLTITDKDGKSVPNPLFIEKLVMEHEGHPALMSFLKIGSEVYLLMDHAIGTPEQRWIWLEELKEFMAARATQHGLEQMSCWIPKEIETSFEKRLVDLGFTKSPWSCYTLTL